MPSPATCACSSSCWTSAVSAAAWCTSTTASEREVLRGRRRGGWLRIANVGRHDTSTSDAANTRATCGAGHAHLVTFLTATRRVHVAEWCERTPGGAQSRTEHVTPSPPKSTTTPHARTTARCRGRRASATRGGGPYPAAIWDRDAGRPHPPAPAPRS